MFNKIVYIGRFQPFHNAHLETIKQASQLAEKVVILLGSSNQPRSIKNPLTTVERNQIIIQELDGLDINYSIEYIQDFLYDDDTWAKQVYSKVPGDNVAIIGHNKDDSSYYLEMLSEWHLVTLDAFGDINATDIRTALYKDQLLDDLDLSDGTKQFLMEFKKTLAYSKIATEYQFVQQYKAPYQHLEFPPIFVTVDIVVKYQDQLALIQRNGEIGNGLWALPGGFLDHNETIEAAVHRELFEETGISGKLTYSHMVDNPNRSNLGRVITHVYVCEVDSTQAIAGDDASAVRFVDMYDVLVNYRSKLFSDHYSIIYHTCRKAGWVDFIQAKYQ
jgi:bifunctional NMN adenylyltransferase/nudix hydrolase